MRYLPRPHKPGTFVAGAAPHMAKGEAEASARVMAIVGEEQASLVQKLPARATATGGLGGGFKMYQGARPQQIPQPWQQTPRQRPVRESRVVERAPLYRASPREERFTTLEGVLQQRGKRGTPHLADDIDSLVELARLRRVAGVPGRREVSEPLRDICSEAQDLPAWNGSLTPRRSAVELCNEINAVHTQIAQPPSGLTTALLLRLAGQGRGSGIDYGALRGLLPSPRVLVHRTVG